MASRFWTEKKQWPQSAIWRASVLRSGVLSAMVDYYKLSDSLPAYAAGQKTGDRLRERRSLADFAKAMQSGDFGAASGSLAQMGDVQGASQILNIPGAQAADDLDSDLKRARINDIGADNRRADQILATDRQFKQFKNAREEAESRLGGGQKPTANQSDYRVAQERVRQHKGTKPTTGILVTI